MASIVCQTHIVNIGKLAKSFQQACFIITFKENAPEDLSDYCVILPNQFKVSCPLSVGQKLYIGENSYSISAIGNLVNVNFPKLGHITIVFDGAKQAKLDGMIHVVGQYPDNLAIGDKFIIEAD